MRKRSKFGVSLTVKGKAERTCTDYVTGRNIVFDSKLEMQYYQQVVIPGLQDGSIKQVIMQQKYRLQPAFKYQGKSVRPINYISDFTILYSDGSKLIVDVKGKPTADAKLKKKMMHYVYPDENFVWMSYTKETGWMEYDALEKYRKAKKKEKKDENK